MPARERGARGGDPASPGEVSPLPGPEPHLAPAAAMDERCRKVNPRSEQRIARDEPILVRDHAGTPAGVPTDHRPPARELPLAQRGAAAVPRNRAGLP